MLSLLVAASMTTALAVPNPRVLVFSKTTGFRHDNIPSAIAAIKKMGEEHHFPVDATEDASVFTDENLRKYDLVCFASTTGDILDESQQKALEKFVDGGKGWMGIHSASDTEYDWPWYAELVGAYFKSHPPGGQHVLVNIENRGNPSTNSLPRFWVRPDEWYDWRVNPRGKVTVLASLDEGFYRPNPQDHPIAWCHWQGKGRAWYTEMGHFKEAYTEKWYLEHLYGGLMWAAQGGVKPEGAQEPDWNGSLNVSEKAASVTFSTKQTYGDCYLHAEFKTSPDSNATVYLGGRYGVTLSEKNAGALMSPEGVIKPSTDATIGNSDWNVLDVVYRAPRMNGGRKVKNAEVIELRVNGVVVQQNQEFDSYSPDSPFHTEAAIGPVFGKLISGSTTVREVWVKKLAL